MLSFHNLDGARVQNARSRVGPFIISAHAYVPSTSIKSSSQVGYEVLMICETPPPYQAKNFNEMSYTPDM